MKNLSQHIQEGILDTDDIDSDLLELDNIIRGFAKGGSVADKSLVDLKKVVNSRLQKQSAYHTRCKTLKDFIEKYGDPVILYETDGSTFAHMRSKHESPKEYFHIYYLGPSNRVYEFLLTKTFTFSRAGLYDFRDRDIKGPLSDRFLLNAVVYYGDEKLIRMIWELTSKYAKS